MKLNIKKMTIAGMLIALTVALSGFSIPIGASRCFPIQHLVNVLAAVILGPGYAVSIAFCTSLIRNLMGTGTLLAFPGSMIGALLSSIVYMQINNAKCSGTFKLLATAVGEVIGTGILGGLIAYPIAVLLLGKQAALFAYVLPFSVSTIGGSALGFLMLLALQKAKTLNMIEDMLGVSR